MNREAPVIVADTTPLNYLVQLGQISLLENLFGDVFVPRSVIAELSHVGAPSDVQVWAASPPAWLKVKDDVPFDADLADVLDPGEPGERDAIALATQIVSCFPSCRRARSKTSSGTAPFQGYRHARCLTRRKPFAEARLPGITKRIASAQIPYVSNA